MSQIKEIKNRITSIKKTQQITRAMKMIAGVKFHKAETLLTQVRPFAFMINDVVKDVSERNYEMRNPFFRKVAKTHNKELLVIVTGDRGLCGNYNSAVIRKVQKLLNDSRSYEMVLIGKKGRIVFNKPGEVIKLAIDNPGSDVTDEYLKNVATQLIELYAQYNSVSMIYTEFVNAVKRNVIDKRVLPICDKFEKGKRAELLYEMDEDEILEDLANTYITSCLRHSLTESAVSEESARVTAMDSATNNANDMIRSLTLVYNRVRQAGITKEIIEISSGAEAFASA